MDYNDKAISVHLYNFLCIFYGSEEVVKLRRILYSAGEVLSNGNNSHTTLSGSRAEGLKLEGSDYDEMWLFKKIVYHPTLIIQIK